MSFATGADLGNNATLRKNSVGVLEMQDENGRRKTVDLETLNAADAALAAKFGYKPV